MDTITKDEYDSGLEVAWKLSANASPMRYGVSKNVNDHRCAMITRYTPGAKAACFQYTELYDK